LGSQTGRARAGTSQTDGDLSHARLGQCITKSCRVGPQVDQRGRLEHEIDGDDRWVEHEVHGLTFDLKTLRCAQ